MLVLIQLSVLHFLDNKTNIYYSKATVKGK